MRRVLRRVWRAAWLVALLLFVALVLLRQPLADWFWNRPQVEQLLEQGEQALREGRLSAVDGSGARERFAAALALDGDRPQARDGLQRTGETALQQAAQAVQAGRLPQAQQALALARELQVPQARADALAEQLRQHQVHVAGAEASLQRARQALAEKRLVGSDDAALPLLQQVLELRPDDIHALEARDDALADLLQQVRQQAARGELQAAATGLAQARAYDPAHADLPQSQGELNSALDRQGRRALRALARHQLDTALRLLGPALPLGADDAAVQQVRGRVQRALLDEAGRLARDFEFVAAQRRLRQAAELGAGSAALAAARRQIQRAQVAQAALDAPARPPAQRERELKVLLQRLARSEAAGRLIAPPGGSAYDALREAQALAPQDARVQAAARRLLPASGRCFEDSLRQNRLQAAGACLQAWQALAPGDEGLATARVRLAQRWIAIGSEQLGRGELAAAERAARQAAWWQDGSVELQAFQQRLQQARAGSGR